MSVSLSLPFHYPFGLRMNYPIKDIEFHFVLLLLIDHIFQQWALSLLRVEVMGTHILEGVCKMHTSILVNTRTLVFNVRTFEVCGTTAH